MLQPPLPPPSPPLPSLYTLYSHGPYGHRLLPLFRWPCSLSACICGIYTTVTAAAVSGQTRVHPTTSETGPRRDGNDVIHGGLHGYERRNDVMVNPASWSGLREAFIKPRPIHIIHTYIYIYTFWRLSPHPFSSNL